MVEQLTSKFEEASQVMKDAILAVHTAFEANLLAKTMLNDAQNAILVANADDPKKLGSNEAVRQASLKEQTSTEVEIARLAEAALREKQHLLELARHDMELLRNIKHLTAIAAGVSLN